MANHETASASPVEHGTKTSFGERCGRIARRLLHLGLWSLVAGVGLKLVAVGTAVTAPPLAAVAWYASNIAEWLGALSLGGAAVTGVAYAVSPSRA